MALDVDSVREQYCQRAEWTDEQSDREIGGTQEQYGALHFVCATEWMFGVWVEEQSTNRKKQRHSDLRVAEADDRQNRHQL